MSKEQEKPDALKFIEQMEVESNKAIADAGVMTEDQMREAMVPWLKTPEELMAYIKTLTDRPHGYGTCPYAVSMAAVAAYNYVAGKLGITGFQSGFADLDIIRRNRGLDFFRILNLDDLLFPQYCNKEHFPSWEELVVKYKDTLAEKAKKKLAENPDAHADVIAHWKVLAGQ